MNKTDRANALNLLLLSLNNELAKSDLTDQEKKNTYANCLGLLRDCLKPKYQPVLMATAAKINQRNKNDSRREETIPED